MTGNHNTKPLPIVEEDENTYEHVIKYTGVFGGVQGLSLMVNIVRNKFASILLGGAGLALVAQCNNIVNTVNAVTNLGLSFSAVRNLSELVEQGDAGAVRDYIRVIRTWSLWVALLAVAICILSSPLISYYVFDGDYTYIPWVCLLSPVLFGMAVTTGEAAILKALRALKRLAVVNVIGAFSTLLLTIPFFYFWGIRGILVALNVSVLALTAIHLAFTCRLYAWQVSLFSFSCFRKGMGLVRIGLPYVAALFMSAVSALAISSQLWHIGPKADVGYYQMGYNLMVVYFGSLFVAMEADYFPRLSAISHCRPQMNVMVNRQIDASVLFISPLLALAMLVMPILVQILYSRDFMVMKNMVLCAGFYSFFKAVSLPLAYIALAKGRSVLFFCMEVAYTVTVVVLVPFCYRLWGLTGAGIALSLSNLVELLLLFVTYSGVFGFRFERKVMLHTVMQFFLLAGLLGVCLLQSGWWRNVPGLVLVFISCYSSWRILRKESHILSRLYNRLPARIHIKKPRKRC